MHVVIDVHVLFQDLPVHARPLAQQVQLALIELPLVAQHQRVVRVHLGLLLVLQQLHRLVVQPLLLRGRLRHTQANAVSDPRREAGSSSGAKSLYRTSSFSAAACKYSSKSVSLTFCVVDRSSCHTNALR